MTADALSHAPVNRGLQANVLERETNLYVDSILRGLSAIDKRLEEIRER